MMPNHLRVVMIKQEPKIARIVPTTDVTVSARVKGLSLGI